MPNWGYDRLAKKVREESIDEMRHAELVIDRILFLEGVPNMQRYHKLHVGETVKEQLETDLQLEYAAIAFLNQGIEACRKCGDNATEDMMTQDPRVRGRAHRLARDPARADSSGRRAELPVAADQRLIGNATADSIGQGREVIQAAAASRRGHGVRNTCRHAGVSLGRARPARCYRLVARDAHNVAGDADPTRA